MYAAAHPSVQFRKQEPPSLAHAVAEGMCRHSAAAGEMLQGTRMQLEKLGSLGCVDEVFRFAKPVAFRRWRVLRIVGANVIFAVHL